MSKSTPIDADTFMRRVKLLVLLVFLIVTIPMGIYTFVLHARLGGVEDTLRYRSPIDGGLDIEGEDVVLRAVQGQSVYVPAYSHVYHQDGQPHLLTITLSVRNTSVDHPIIVRSVRYFDTRGRAIKSYLEAPVRLPPLATTEFLISREDSAGGSGANFLVDWVAEQPVSEPVIEAVMIDTSEQQGISFVCRGVVVKDLAPVSSEELPED